MVIKCQMSPTMADMTWHKVSLSQTSMADMTQHKASLLLAPKPMAVITCHWHQHSWQIWHGIKCHWHQHPWQIWHVTGTNTHGRDDMSLAPTTMADMTCHWHQHPWQRWHVTGTNTHGRYDRRWLNSLPVFSSVTDSDTQDVWMDG